MKINFWVIDKRNNYYVDEHSDNGNNNSYQKYRYVNNKLINKKGKYLLGKIALNSLCASIINYKQLCKKANIKI